MPAGETTTGGLADSLPSIIADARIVREYEGTWRRTTEVRDMAKGTGLDWQEISLGQLEAQGITETTRNENFQQIVDTLFSITPAMSQIAIKITDKTHRRIAAVVDAKVGTLGGNAMARFKNDTYLSLFSTFSTTASPGTGNALAFGHISAAESNITSNVVEPSNAPIYTVLHGFQINDLRAELVAGISSATTDFAVSGLTEDVYRKGFQGMISTSQVFADGNIAVDGTPDARGATHARDAVVAVLGMGIKNEVRRDPSFGGGADEIFLTDEFGFGERSAGNWAYQHFSDATAPTS